MAADMPASEFSWLVIAKAGSKYPACAMDEYARRRFTLLWTRAPTLPKVMDSAAATHKNQNRPGALISKTTRSSTANAAAFGAVDMKPTTGTGAPSYTSGVHTWNGATATLNPRPTNISAIAV